jgi:hypothetical protein
MKSTPLRSAMGRHKTRLFFVTVALALLVSLISPYLARWAIFLLGFLLFAFIYIPMALGLGPIGRRFAAELNEEAVAANRQRRGLIETEKTQESSFSHKSGK